MKWSDTIRFQQPLRQLCVLADAPAQAWADTVRAREEAAYQRGRQDAENAMARQLAAQRAELAELQNGVLQSLKAAVPQVVREAETGLIALALEAAGRIVAGLPISVELVESVVREALRQAEDSADILVQLHPEDLALLRNKDSKILAGVPGSGPLRFVASTEVTRGGCLVQTRFGVIDARREVKLEQLTQAVNS